MSRYWTREYSELFEQEGWRGYEFWSAQVEAEMEVIEEKETSVVRLAGREKLSAKGARAHPLAKAPRKGAGDVLPF